MKKKDLEKFFIKENYTKIDVDNLIQDLNITKEELINNICNMINNWKQLYKHKEFILLSIKLISFISYNYIIEEDNIKNFKKRLHKIETKLYEAYKKNNCSVLKDACEEIKNINFMKQINIENLENIIKRLIDKQEEIFIIENIINLNSSYIQSKNIELFDYTFNKLLSIISKESYLDNYYINLLKIFYDKNIDSKYYTFQLLKYKNNDIFEEVYNIINNTEKPLSKEQILIKYYKEITPTPYELNTFYKTIKQNNRIITIDNLNTIRRDDALSIKKDGNNYLVQIYISDIVPTINYESDIDKTALLLFKNSYLYNNDVINIYHNNIVENLSLNANSKRNVITLNIIFNNTFNIIDYFITTDTIKINNNYNYKHIENILNGSIKNEYYNDLLILKLITDKLKKENLEKEKYWKQKSKNRTNQINRIYDSKSHDIIAELSILYGKCIADVCSNNNIPCIYRCQDKSYITDIFKEEKINLNESLYQTIDSLYLFPYYSQTPQIHYGLNTDKYVQATNPLRKYPDGYIQRLLHKYYFKDIDFNDNNIENLITYFNIRSKDTNMFESEYNKTLSQNRH